MRRHENEAEQGAGGYQGKIKQHDGGGVAGDGVVLISRQEARAQPDEQDLHDAEVDQP